MVPWACRRGAGGRTDQGPSAAGDPALSAAYPAARGCGGLDAGDVAGEHRAAVGVLAARDVGHAVAKHARKQVVPAGRCW